MTTGPGQKRLRVGLLGGGYIAQWHLQALRCLKQVDVVAVCDVNLARAQSLAAAHGIVGSYVSLETMAAEARLDVVHVLTPPATHYDLARRALEAGLHVLIEKPLCVDRDDCRQLAQLAHERGLSLGVSHNFLFTEEYERLRADVRAGRLGRIDHVSVVWNKPLGPLAGGPFDIWMLQRPENIILEIGPHSIAHLHDLLEGPPDTCGVRVDDPTDLPNGQRFFRRWRVNAEKGRAAADLLFSFNAGIPEHYLHVRGTHGSATVDFEAQTYVLGRPTRYGVDFDRFWRVRRAGRSLQRQALTSLAHYLLSKFKLSRRGNAFGTSIHRCVTAFYETVAGRPDERISADNGIAVVSLCQQLADQVRNDHCFADGAPLAATASPSAAASSGGSKPSSLHSSSLAATGDAESPCPDSMAARGKLMLVLGGTGFIGRELVRQLVAQRYRVRVLTRQRDLPAEEGVEVVRGSMSDPAALVDAMRDVDCVFHLARAHAKLWPEYYREDVQGTGRVAQACLAAGVRRLVYTGTIDSYYAGRKAGTIREETQLDPQIRRRNYYARAKFEAEALLMQMHCQQQLPVVTFRPGIVVGRGGSPFHWGVGMWNANAVCQFWGDGENPLPIVLVEDVAAALVRSIELDGLEGQSFNLVGEPCLTARQYVTELERCLQVDLEAHQVPIWKFYAMDMAKWCVKCLVRHPDRKMPSYRDWESRTQRARFDCTKAKHVLGWQPTENRELMIHHAIRLPAAEFSGN